MIQTSYFAKYKESNGVSIARIKPHWFHGWTYPPLMPAYDIISDYKAGEISEDEYITLYHECTLDRLDPDQVYDDLKGTVLLCYEKPGAFCHRRIVAKWLENELGIVVPEVVF